MEKSSVVAGTGDVHRNCDVEVGMEDIAGRLSPVLLKRLEYSIALLRKAERLATAYDPENGYFLAFSGGKDSQCLYHIAKLSGVKFQAHMNLTSVDPPEVIRFVKREYPDVELVKPRDSIFSIAVRRRILPTMRVRWCCAEYKEGAGAGKVTLIGIRRAESFRRAKRNEVEISSRKYSGNLDGLEDWRKEHGGVRRGRKPAGYREVTIVNADGERVLGCIRGKESLLVSPILHWSDSDVWEFLSALGVSHCELYDEGYSRIGCILCPMSRPEQKRKEIERWPHVKRKWIKAIKAIRNGGGISKRTYHQSGGGTQTFKDGYIWWNIKADMVPCRNVRGMLRNGQFSEARTSGDTSSSPKTGCKPDKTGFSQSSSPARLTEEQENEIAENIFDWWVSGKSYEKWYADKFGQLSLEFGIQ